MFEKLKKIFQGEPPPIAEKINDPVLGTLSWSKDDEAWISDASHTGLGFAFLISGTPQPHAALVRHAADILEKKDEFVRRVQRFLSEEAPDPGSGEFKEEISGLKIESVCLFWPDRPDDGMIYFEGGNDYRVWRCDYINRTPKDLGFDS